MAPHILHGGIHPAWIANPPGAAVFGPDLSLPRNEPRLDETPRRPGLEHRESIIRMAIESPNDHVHVFALDCQGCEQPTAMGAHVDERLRDDGARLE